MHFELRDYVRFGRREETFRLGTMRSRGVNNSPELGAAEVDYRGSRARTVPRFDYRVLESKSWSKVNGANCRKDAFF